MSILARIFVCKGPKPDTKAIRVVSLDFSGHFVFSESRGDLVDCSICPLL